MQEKLKLINNFESLYWEIDPELRNQLLRLSMNQLAIKLGEWQQWAWLGGCVRIGG